MENLKDKLRSVGYITTQEVCDDLQSAIDMSKDPGQGISGTLLRGPAGCGKTSLVEALAKVLKAKVIYYQGVPNTSSGELVADLDVSAVIRQQPEKAYRKGCILRAFEEAQRGSNIILFIDEVDKFRLEVDAFLLELLQQGRISGTVFGDQALSLSEMPNLLVFLASNDQRDLQLPLMSRLRNMDLELPTPDFMRSILQSCSSPEASQDMINWLCEFYNKQLQIQSQLTTVLSIREALKAICDDTNLLRRGVTDVQRRVSSMARNWLLKQRDDKDRNLAIISATEFVKTDKDKKQFLANSVAPSLEFQVRVIDKRTPKNMPAWDGYVEEQGVLISNQLVRRLIAQELNRGKYSDKKLVWGAFLLENQESHWKLFWNAQEPTSVHDLVMILRNQMTKGVQVTAMLETTSGSLIEFKKAMLGSGLQEAQVGETGSVFGLPNGDSFMREEGDSKMLAHVTSEETLRILIEKGVLPGKKTEEVTPGKTEEEEYW